MLNNGVILKLCQVVDIFDETDGGRIKVRMSPEDDRKSDNELPYVFPLLPKLIHIKPKIGETVLIVLTEVSNGYSNRYYIGPIISQPQFMEKDSFLPNALSLYPSSTMSPNVAPSTNPESHGALASNNDIAIYGRKKNDIILSDDEIKIRSGSRLKGGSANGDIVFNRTDPAFIHLKHTDNKRGETGDEYRSTATIVADNINLISNQSKTPFNTTDKKGMITDEEMNRIVEKAHLLPYGDILIEFLKMFLNAFANHSHPYPGLTPCKTDEFNKTISYDLKQILSEHVRIN
jgi:hypothetical protein